MVYNLSNNTLETVIFKQNFFLCRKLYYVSVSKYINAVSNEFPCQLQINVNNLRDEYVSNKINIVTFNIFTYFKVQTARYIY